MTTLTPRSDRATIKTQVLATTRELLRELGNSATIEASQGTSQDGLLGSASLEDDLGLGSIERLELVSRLERRLGVSLAESDIAEAKTIDDVVTAIAGTPEGAGAETARGQGVRQRQSFLSAHCTG